MSKKSVLLTVSTVLLLALMIAIPALAWEPVEGPDVTPEFVAGNPTCVGLGYDFGFKVDPPDAGTYNIDGFNIVTVTTDGVYFDWESTLGMDAVISKGGPNANLYIYDPPTESFGDDGLHSPVNASGEPAGLSHIEFCFDYELDVSKTAETTFTRTYTWDITKDPDGDYAGFTGDSFDHTYEIVVDKTGSVDSAWAVSGTITIENNTPVSATITGVTDSISGFGAVVVNCGVTFPYALGSGQSLECTYSTALPDGSNRTNTASVTTSGAVGGDSDDADVTFGDPTTEVNAEVNVTDDYGTPGDTADDQSFGPFSDDNTVSYTRTFACDGDEGSHTNTATIDETGDYDTATVTVDCYELQVTKDADTSLTRTWTWTINKSADQTDLLLSEGQLFTVNYEVTVDASSEDSGWAVEGDISVHNPAPIDAEITDVNDIVSPNIAADVDCGVTFPYTLVAGGTLNCTYTASLPDDADRLNTVTATLQNYHYDDEGDPTPDGTSNFTGLANVSFEAPTIDEVDECVDVSDTNVGFLGTVCASDAPQKFNYPLWFGANPDADVVLECGENTHTNVADFVTNDSGTTGDDDWTVTATVACEVGCTLTQGYWKTHSEKGPAPYDDTWALLPGGLGADTPFFGSGMTWYQVFWTAPAGNQYYNLAHQYMAAKLNILNGASSTPAVDAAITWAEGFFNTYLPTASYSKTVRNQIIQNASILDQYNNGLIGPGHCSESNGSRVASSTARESYRLSMAARQLGLIKGSRLTYGMLLRTLR